MTIEVGGIYKCHISIPDHSWVYTTATVLKPDETDEIACLLRAGTWATERYLLRSELEQQIGFDSTVTSEYKNVESRLDTLQERLNALSALELYAQVENIRIEVNVLRVHFETHVEYYKGWLDRIKANSWGITS